MKYIIYGINRVAWDFMYIFNELDILYLTDDFTFSKDLLETEYRMETLDTALSDTSYDQIIICDFDKKQKGRDASGERSALWERLCI